MSTEATLRALNVHDRQTLWKNARAKDSDQARDLVARIEQLGLPYSEGGGLKSGDPLLQKIEQVVFSDDARTAGREATEAGRPALEPIDPMLLAALGMDYGSRNGTTREAGWFVAQMMRLQGYETSGRQGKLPPTCVAKTAEIFIPNRPLRRAPT